MNSCDIQCTAKNRWTRPAASPTPLGGREPHAAVHNSLLQHNKLQQTKNRVYRSHKPCTTRRQAGHDAGPLCPRSAADGSTEPPAYEPHIRHSSLFCNEHTILASSASRSMLDANALIAEPAVLTAVTGVPSGSVAAAALILAATGLADFFLSADWSTVNLMASAAARVRR